MISDQSLLLSTTVLNDISRLVVRTAIIHETKNTRPLSEFFTRKSVKKLTNALVMLP